MSHILKKKHITGGKLSRRTLEVPAEMGCCHVVTNVIKILTVGTAIKLSETKIIAQNKKRGYTINNTAKTKIGTDGQT